MMEVAHEHDLSDDLTSLAIYVTRVAGPLFVAEAPWSSDREPS